jgi:hypothetical protein
MPIFAGQSLVSRMPDIKHSVVKKPIPIHVMLSRSQQSVIGNDCQRFQCPIRTWTFRYLSRLTFQRLVVVPSATNHSSWQVSPSACVWRKKRLKLFSSSRRRGSDPLTKTLCLWKLMNVMATFRKSLFDAYISTHREIEILSCSRTSCTLDWQRKEVVAYCEALVFSQERLASNELSTTPFSSVKS